MEYLDPETLGGLNLYAYCNNNPVMSVDPKGTIVLGLLISLIVVGSAAFGSELQPIENKANDGADGIINFSY